MVAKLLFIFASIKIVASFYSAHYVEDRCRGYENVTYILDPSRASTAAGYLRAARFAPYSSNRECLVILQPPPGYGVVLSIRKVDFINTYGCQDYIKIFDSLSGNVTFCRFIFDLQEDRSFHSESGPLKFLYHSDGRGYGLFAEKGFEVVVTTFTKDPGVCSHSEMFRCDNGRCIWKDLTCDMHNNCGDGSDESVHLCDSYVHDFATTYIVYICVGIVFFMFSFSMTMFCCVRRKGILVRSAVDANGFPRTAQIVTPYQAVYPSGFPISENPAGPDSRPEKCLSAHCPEEGFTNPCYPSGMPPAPPPYKP